jgi:glutamate-1-semialdehyde 2,1-aminomutase
MFDDDPGYSKGYLWANAMLKRGVYFHPWHNMFICAAMTEADIDNTIDRADDAFAVVKAAGPQEPVAKLARMRRAA